MQIKSQQDVATGLLFVLIGIGAYWFGADYAMGTWQRPGTGVLPRILAWCLLGTGAALFIKAFMSDGPGLGRWAWRPLIMITIAAIAFALLIDNYGLVAAMVVSMTLAALGTPETRWVEFIVFSLIMLALGILLFSYGLGMPIKVMPWS